MKSIAKKYCKICKRLQIFTFEFNVLHAFFFPNSNHKGINLATRTTAEVIIVPSSPPLQSHPLPAEAEAEPGDYEIKGSGRPVGELPQGPLSRASHDRAGVAHWQGGSQPLAQ